MVWRRWRTVDDGEVEEVSRSDVPRKARMSDWIILVWFWCLLGVAIFCGGGSGGGGVMVAVVMISGVRIGRSVGANMHPSESALCFPHFRVLCQNPKPTHGHVRSKGGIKTCARFGPRKCQFDRTSPSKESFWAATDDFLGLNETRSCQAPQHPHSSVIYAVFNPLTFR